MTFLGELLYERLNVPSARVGVERRGEVGGLHDYPTPARRWSWHEGHGEHDRHEYFGRVIHPHLVFGIFQMLRQLSLPHIQTTCFFCQSHINPPPRDPRNFRCPHCQCWNRYDAHGEITSNEPAMHESMNVKSFTGSSELISMSEIWVLKASSFRSWRSKLSDYPRFASNISSTTRSFSLSPAPAPRFPTPRQAQVQESGLFGS